MPPPTDSAVMDGAGDNSVESLDISGVLTERLRCLEASYVKLREQFNLLLEEKSCSNKDSDEEKVSDAGDTPGSYRGPGVFYSGSPYRNVLEDLGHALYVTKVGTAEIIYWNPAAEKLYGYKYHEVIGQRCSELLVCEEYNELAMHSVKRLSCGQSWSGQFPFKKRNGQTFMAIVTKSLWYEDDELYGVITVSSDGAFLNKINAEKTRTSQSSNGQPGSRPQTGSSVSYLASKVFLLNRGEDARNASANARERGEADVDITGGQSQKPPRAPVAKVMSKLHITGFGNIGGEKCGNNQHNGHDEPCADGNVAEPNLSSASEGKYSHVLEDFQNILKGSCFIPQRPIAPENAQIKFSECSKASRSPEQLPRTCFQINDKYRKPQVGNSKLSTKEDSSGQQLDNQQSRKSGENARSSHGSSSNKNQNELNLIVNYEILWEDISLREEIGQGAYAVVYHGIWKGSVFPSSQYYSFYTSEIGK
ncbi:hypothetical protein CQW23_00319 [Capsicum baccatum]|uniref:PAS domain-containing protein n=1 Tax=Capsicum baccatum TaxID=33114 RepID=A0A2G2XKE6_CAPBA|nr:hypothetical protein CQW23_00319 [Capsicum baccatum]